MKVTTMKVDRILVAFILFLPTLLSAQTPVKKDNKPVPSTEKGTIFFQATSLSLGEVDEQGGRKEVTFNFGNIGKGELRILNVESGCGCTSAYWDEKKSYKQGEKGTILVSFNPDQQSGDFNRSLTVTTNGDPATTFLSIQGNVVGATATFRENFPVKIGQTHLTSSVLNIPHAKTGRHDSVAVTLHNSSGKRMKIVGVKAPEYLSYRADANFLQAGEATDIYIIIKPELLNKYGPLEEQITIVTDESETPNKKIVFKANVEENFENLTPEQRKAAPKIVFTETVKDLGEVYYKEVVDYDFEVTNKGKSDLILRRAYGSCGCTVASVSSEPIKKGKKGKVSVRFDGANLYNTQVKTITVISNDPNNPVVTLTIKAKMVEPGVKK